MNPYEPIKSFDYFINKVCTVIIRPISMKLNPEQNLDYFVGIVNSVNECGICITNVVNHKKTFIMMPAVVAIAEETIVEKDNFEENNKEYQDRKKEVFGNNTTIYPGKTPSKPITKVNDNPFVDIAAITRHAKAAKDKVN
jgi:hypothetical protein